MNRAELAANLFNVVSVLLAGRNSVHTWWTGIIACGLFGWVFFTARLYADSTLQLFFIGTSVVGWWHWTHAGPAWERPVTRTSRPSLVAMALAGAGVAVGYGLLLRRFSDAFAPIADSTVLAFSVVAQLLLLTRRLETWWFWLLVNTIAVPLFVFRGLYLTAALYFGFWVHAIVALRYWRREMEAA